MRRTFALAALAAALVPAVASAVPPPPRPFCTIRLTERTWASSPDFGDVTTPWYATYC